MKRVNNNAILFAVSLFVMWSITAEAAFKWGADLNQSFSWKNGWDLNDDGNNAVATRNNEDVADQYAGKNATDAENFFTTLLGVNGQWDLVKDTAFNFRLAAQFDWLGSNTGGPLQSSVPGFDEESGTAGLGAGPSGTNPFGLWVNQAVLSFTDFGGFPVNAKLGRQNVWLGKGFVLGNRLFGAGPTIYANGYTPTGSHNAGGRNGQDNSGTSGNLPLNAISGGSLNAPETSDFTGFDGVTFNVHLLDNKLNLDGGYLLVSNALVQSQPDGGDQARVARNLGTADDETLSFLNLGYKQKSWNAETYFLFNHDREPIGNIQAATDTTKNSDVIYTFGVRGDADVLSDMSVVKNLNTYAETAYQMGELGAYTQTGASVSLDDTLAALHRKRKAYAFDLGADLAFTTNLLRTAGLEVAYFSGMNPLDAEGQSGGTTAETIQVQGNSQWQVWDPQFRGKFFTKIADFLDSVYETDTLNLNAPGASEGETVGGRFDAGFTNRMIVLGKFGFEPLKKTTLGLTAAWLQAVQPPQAGASKNLGVEVDWDLGYAFSSVVNWYFDGGVFKPGAYYSMPSSGTAQAGIMNAYLFRTGFKVNLG